MARPEILTPYFASLRSFRGVGPQLDNLLKRFFRMDESEMPSTVDLLMHMPERVIDRRHQCSIARAIPGQICTLCVHVNEHLPAPPGKRSSPHRVRVHDESGELTLIYFGNNGGWVEKSLPVGETRYISGEISLFAGTKQIAHPDYVLPPEKRDAMPLLEPVYPLTHGLSAKVLRRLMASALAAIPPLPEWTDPDLRARNGWPAFHEALHMVHRPDDPADIALTGPARMRLAHDEYLAGQITLQLVRARMVAKRGIARHPTGELTSRLLTHLPFSLTEGQAQAFGDIRQDLESPDRMSRLLQGDVGAGKTIVALLGMLATIESGAQAALMAPTEILATQHFNTLSPLCEKIGVRIALVTGKMKAAKKREALAAIQQGTIQIVVGTHALFQSGVNFADLGLSVVDEQHRFGVHQRLALSDKGSRSDLLVMTATPIPRTLVMTHFGDMAVSQLRDKPAGRQPIKTATVAASACDTVVSRLLSQVNAGAQAYWVCPLVEESEQLDLVSAQDRYQQLQQHFGDRVGLIHGRMKPEEKQATMDAFARNELAVLVATTVIEVGVDVPNATIMIVEHAERFGLSQLHQLRGRVGRGSKQSSCLLMYHEPLGETARQRLEAMKATQDGFEIAEQDLRLRGAGDVLGTRQSGMPG
ncbi:MAG TPA: ATP-dependent DNA helicase RecG, partial [Devosia sp.]|nr:ATP-dependent DNA helicase RecG [Devosia sp.]